MNKIRRLKFYRNVENSLSKTFALTSAGFIGASIALNSLNKPITLPVTLGIGFAVESCLMYAQAKLSDIQIITNEYLENKESKTLVKSL